MKESKEVAPCGLYCGACISRLVNKSCHGCGCECGKCDSWGHTQKCDIYRCCINQKGHNSCHECKEFPCSMLIRFCHDPVWLTHSSVIENLRRRKAIGNEKWLKEQKEIWGNERYLQRWLWLQKENKNRLERSQQDSKNI